jgi:hypothetical protein
MFVTMCAGSDTGFEPLRHKSIVAGFSWRASAKADAYKER